LRFTSLKVQMQKDRFEQVSSSYIIWLKPICSRCCGVMRTAASEPSCLNQISFKKDWPPKWMWISKQSSTEISWIQFQKLYPKSWTLNNPKNPKP
jgi:hypothetical protein